MISALLRRLARGGSNRRPGARRPGPAASNRRGAVALAAAGIFPLLVGFSGYAIDSTRVWLVRSRLKTSLDAAVLVAARQIGEATRDAQVNATFWANFGTRSYLGSSVGNPVVTQIDANLVRVSATASLPTTLLDILGHHVVAFTDSSVAQRLGTGMELSIVLDQTSSMGQFDGATGMSKIDAAKAAVRTLLDILYGAADTQPNFYVSVVPFARTINIGTGNAGWLNTTGLPTAGPTGWSLARWSGCVEARQGGHDITEANPAAAPFRPYFWQDTYRQHGTAPTNCQASQAYLPVGGVSYCMADNDWGATALELTRNPHWRDYLERGRAPADAGAPAPIRYVGPNALCAQNPILPLTASKTTVLQSVDAIVAPGRSGGTTVVAGMQGAWFTLSPQWQGYWNTPPGPGGAALPLAYGTRNMRKAVVLLSDGDNNWLGTPQVLPSRSGNELFYNAYGRLADNRLPITPAGNYSTTSTRADAALDTRFSTVCEAMKQQGIIVYVIGFEVAQPAHRALLQGCATSTQHYFESPNASTLQTVFRQIGNQLSSLRLTE
jgi:Flp pilus assembly protein TadG